MKCWGCGVTPTHAYSAMSSALDAMLIWFHGEPHYRTGGGIPMGMPDNVRRKVKRALRRFENRPGKEIR